MLLTWARLRQLRGRSDRSRSSIGRSRSGEPAATPPTSPSSRPWGASLMSATSGSPDLDLPIEDLDLSERPRNCLKRAQVNTVGELVQKTVDDLLAITNFGQKSLDEVLQKLDERGLALRTKGGE